MKINKLISLCVLSPVLAVAHLIDFQKINQSVVFVANESSPFELAYGSNPGGYAYFRSVYDYFWPARHFHGSGSIISSEGHIITNAHVVNNSTKVLVVMRTDTMQVYEAKVLGRDFRSDLAVLKVETHEGGPLPYIHFGDSDELQPGDPVVCIGNPLMECLENTLTAGVVSGVNRNGFGDPIEGYVQTDVVINGGNSGGPILNSKGEMIGVCAWTWRGIGVEGLHFAIPSNVARQIARQIIEDGRISQGFLGVGLETNKEVLFGTYFFDKNEGARIKAIILDSPAEEAGLQEGDRILGLNGHPIDSSYNFRNRLVILEEGTTVQLTIERDGVLFEVNVTLGSDALSEEYSFLAGFYLVL